MVPVKLYVLSLVDSFQVVVDLFIRKPHGNNIIRYRTGYDVHALGLVDSGKDICHLAKR